MSFFKKQQNTSALPPRAHFRLTVVVAYLLVVVAITIPLTMSKYASTAAGSSTARIANFHGGHVVHAHDHFENQMSPTAGIQAVAEEGTYYLFNTLPHTGRHAMWHAP